MAIIHCFYFHSFIHFFPDLNDAEEEAVDDMTILMLKVLLAHPELKLYFGTTCINKRFAYHIKEKDLDLQTTKFFTFESQYSPRQAYRLEYHTLFRLSLNVDHDLLINKIVGGYGGVVVDGKKSTLYCFFSSTYKHPYQP